MLPRTRVSYFVRTDRENKLGDLFISFEVLKGKALPLTRSEDMETIDASRIHLQFIVHFAAELL